MKAARVLLLAAGLALGGCGGGGSPEAVVADPCKPLTQVRVQLFGDSTMVGWDGATGTEALHPPAVALQSILDARFGRGNTFVTSRASSGTSAVELVAGVDRMNQPWPRSVDADIIVVNHGINDLTHHGDPAAYRAALRSIAANTAGAKLIFETPNSIDVHETDLVPYSQIDLAFYAQIMRDVAAEVRAPVADTFTLPPEIILLGDWAHPTDAGYVNIVEASLAPAVVPQVAQLLCR